ncbi:MAG: hypothetical protein KDD15_07500 [Lewinella sp.]|nr:hypothetical protein [Lewinella sp.]
MKNIGHEELQPPVAILIYNPDDLQQAAYYPFAAFSPEWQALQYAHGHEVEVRFMDLPAGYSFALQGLEESQFELFHSEDSEQPPVPARWQQDPLGQLAEIAGYADRERWWEVTFERRANPTQIFPAIIRMIDALRFPPIRNETSETLRREAFMRESIRKVQKEGFEQIVVVCGAWHAPVLGRLDEYKSTADKSILRGIKKKKIAATWIPWSYPRLATSSGYAAGIISPAWYELLYRKREDTVAHWMVKVVSLLRELDLNVSPAHAQEAARLANTLAGLRDLNVPGLDELQEAALSILCEGEPARMDLIRQQLVVGERVGQVPADIPVPPLQKDIEQTIRSTRMTKYWGQEGKFWLKATKNNPYGFIDLRVETDRQKSLLLHRLRIIDLPWGAQRATSELTQGSFKEVWELRWQPDFAIIIIEKSALGNTLLEAATQQVIQEAEVAVDIKSLTELILEILQADLSLAIAPVMAIFQRMVAAAQDVQILLAGLSPLVTIIRFGDIRQTDVGAVEQVLNEIVPRICLGLPGICQGIEEEVAREIFQDMIKGHHALSQLGREDFLEDWYAALHKIADNPSCHSILQGTAARLLFDKGMVEPSKSEEWMYLALSPAQAPLAAAHWLEGFLHGSGLILVHYPPLWQLLDNWVRELPDSVFPEILPLLRRTFSVFPPVERKRMLHLAQKGPAPPIEAADLEEDVPAAAQALLDTLQLLLG